MKFTYEQKVEIYNRWKYKYESITYLSKEYKSNHENVRYMIYLADRHGIEILRHGKNRYYSKEFKKEAIDRVLIGNENILDVSLDLGIPGLNTLRQWVKNYVNNGYNVIEKKRGRHGKKEKSKDNRRIISGEREITSTEPETYYRERILKKIGRLSNGARKARVEEIATAVTELRHELKCSLEFILETINSNPKLPHITRSTYYYTISKEDKDKKNEELMEEIRNIFNEHKQRYGYRRITLELKRRGHECNHKAVKRLMSKLYLYGKTPRAKYKSYKGDMNGTVKNLLLDKNIDEVKHKTYYDRNFSTTTVNEKWTTDVSEFHIASGKLYFSPILDIHTHEIISYSISKHPNFQQTLDMLDKAFSVYPNLKGLIFHSDQGWQYQMQQYHKILKEHGIRQSMSRKGNCLDNCVMENFFGKMKNEMFYGHEFEFKTLDQLQKAMEEYIDYYNNKRIQSRLKGLTPCEARNQALSLKQ